MLFTNRKKNRRSSRNQKSQRRNSTIRRVQLLETLEDRRLMTVAGAFQNPLCQLDVNNDGLTTPQDILYIINHLNQPAGQGQQGAAFYDANGDHVITPLDALHIINDLNIGNPATNTAQYLTTVSGNHASDARMAETVNDHVQSQLDSLFEEYDQAQHLLRDELQVFLSGTEDRNEQESFDYLAGVGEKFEQQGSLLKTQYHQLIERTIYDNSYQEAVDSLFGSNDLPDFTDPTLVLPFDPSQPSDSVEGYSAPGGVPQVIELPGDHQNIGNAGGVFFKGANGPQNNGNAGGAAGNNNAGAGQQADPKAEAVDPLTAEERNQLGPKNQGLVDAVRDAEEKAQKAQKAVEDAEKKQAEIDKELNKPENQPQLDKLDAEAKKLDDRIKELEKELEELEKAFQNELCHKQVVAVGVDENGKTIWKDADTNALKVFKAKIKVKNELKDLKAQRAAVEEQRQEVRKRVDPLKTEQGKADQSLKDAEKLATAARDTVNQARRTARDKAAQVKSDKAAADRQAEYERRQRIADQKRKDFKDRKPLIKKAIQALKDLDVIDDDVNADDVIDDAERKFNDKMGAWVDAMMPTGGAVAAGIGADVATGNSSMGTVISVMQAFYGLLAIRRGQLVPSHTKAHLDKLNGITANRLPWGTSDPYEWLVEHGHAADRDEAVKVKAEMDKLMNVNPVNVR